MKDNLYTHSNFIIFTPIYIMVRVLPLLLCVTIATFTLTWCSLEQPQSSSQGDTSAFVDTEGTNLPEIIIDEETANDIPEPEADEQTFEELQEANETLEENNTGDTNTTQNDSPQPLPEQVNLDITFFAQAPDGIWDLPWKEACEEASVIQAKYYLAWEPLNKQTFKEEVLAFVDLENQMLWKYIDTSMEETQQVYEAFYEGFGQTKIIENPTVDDLKRELAAWHPIIAPFAWRELGNSNFTNWWPRYHVLVIRGYDDQYFYTNDVGTRRGENFPYSYDVIIGAMHDLIPDWTWDIRDGAKRVLVLMND